MSLDYSVIFNVFVDMIKIAMPISIFLYLADLLISFFFSLAFPKRFKGGGNMNEELSFNILVDTNSISQENISTYDIFYNIYLFVGVLTFIVIVFSLYKYLKSVFRFRR